jgi:hypothetical protein
MHLDGTEAVTGQLSLRSYALAGRAIATRIGVIRDAFTEQDLALKGQTVPSVTVKPLYFIDPGTR